MRLIHPGYLNFYINFEEHFWMNYFITKWSEKSKKEKTERVNKKTLYICTETQMGFKRFLHSHVSLKEIIIASFGELLDEKFHFGPCNHRSNTVFIFTMFYFYFKVNQRNLCYKLGNMNSKSCKINL